MRYSLASHILSFEANDASLRNLIGDLQIGGEGSTVDSISVELDQEQYSTTSFPTGAWIHNKNLSKTGRVTIRLSQLSDYVDKFKNLVNLHYSGDYHGLTVTLTNPMYTYSDGSNKICVCKDCYFTKIPSQEYGREAGMDSWVLTCGEISYS